MIEMINGPIIAAGESLSPAVDCRAGKIVRLTMPAAWVGAPLTFAISSDDQGYNDMFDVDGREVQVTVMMGAAIIVPNDYLAAAAFIKFRSGSRDNPIPQPEQRDFAIAIEVPDAPAAPAAAAAARNKVPSRNYKPTNKKKKGKR